MIAKSIIKRMKQDNMFQLELAKHYNLNQRSIERWIYKNSKKLSSNASIELASKYFGIPADQILTKEKA